MNSVEMKALLRSLGADLCGIASVEQFSGAPEGYHPLDVMPSCRSVIAFACRFPAGTLRCMNPVSYTRMRKRALLWRLVAEALWTDIARSHSAA